MDKPNLSGREYTALQYVFATVSSFSELTPTLGKRAALVDGLPERMQLIRDTGERVLHELLSTVPPRKLQHILKDLEHTHLYIKVEAPGLQTVDATAWCYTPAAVLNDCLSMICTDHCLLCDKTTEEAKTCDVRRLLEDALPHEIDGKEGTRCKYSDFTMGLEG